MKILERSKRKEEGFNMTQFDSPSQQGKKGSEVPSHPEEMRSREFGLEQG